MKKEMEGNLKIIKIFNVFFLIWCLNEFFLFLVLDNKYPKLPPSYDEVICIIDDDNTKKYKK